MRPSAPMHWINDYNLCGISTHSSTRPAWSISLSQFLKRYLENTQVTTNSKKHTYSRAHPTEAATERLLSRH